MNKDSKILVTGAKGLLGTALRSLLSKEAYWNTLQWVGDLNRQYDIDYVFKDDKYDYVFHLAGRVHGIGGNTKNQQQAYLDNLHINTNVIEACAKYNVKKVIAMGTGAIYPARLPGGMLNENFIFDGEPHNSEYGYATAKRAMLSHLKICKEQYGLKYVYPISANLYGPHDRFDIENGHVIPSLIRKFFEAKTKGGTVKAWGQGLARRDFLHVDDAARALLTLMNSDFEGPINLGSGEVRSIFNVAEMLSKISGVSRDLVEWDASKPEGAALRSYDLTKLMNLGFKPSISLENGLRYTYKWFEENHEKARK